VTEREQLEGGIAALESQRAVLGDAVVDTALAALRARLAKLAEPEPKCWPRPDRPANEVLGRARALWTERGELLDEGDRAGFLGHVPWHRAIGAAGGAP